MLTYHQWSPVALTQGLLNMAWPRFNFFAKWVRKIYYNITSIYHKSQGVDPACTPVRIELISKTYPYFSSFFVRHREHGRKGYAVAIPRFPAQRTSNAYSVSISKPLDDTGYRFSWRNILRICRSTRWCQTNRSSHNLRQVSILICIPGADNVRIYIKRGYNTHSHRLPVWHCHIFCFHFLVNL